MPKPQTAAWQKQLAEAVTCPAELCKILQLETTTLSQLQTASNFPLRVPWPYLNKIEPGNPNDPLFLQIAPLQKEQTHTPGYTQDPLQESAASPAQGLLHKYPGRVLLTLTGSCAIHCRYCFRRHYPYKEKVPGFSQWQPALDYLASQQDITEVILSGGDPLALKDTLLGQFITELESIPHIQRLRIHTRLPIAIPDRLTSDLFTLLDKSRLHSVLVLHSNHPHELDSALHHALKRNKGTTLLNQSVLLKGVNDSTDTLTTLSLRLFETGVLPYYLHLLDPVEGAAHFAVSEQKARLLMQEITEQLPGYLVPKLVKEEPNKLAKTLIPR